MSKAERSVNGGAVNHEAGWGKELEDLEGLIKSAREAFLAGDETAAFGYSKLMQEANGCSFVDPKYDGVDGFVADAICAFNACLYRYGEEEERPLDLGRRGFRRLEKNMVTPREVRMLILKLGLSGRLVPAPEISEAEGVGQKTITGTLARAKSKLFWSIAQLQHERSA